MKIMRMMLIIVIAILIFGMLYSGNSVIKKWKNTSFDNITYDVRSNWKLHKEYLFANLYSIVPPNYSAKTNKDGLPPETYSTHLLVSNYGSYDESLEEIYSKIRDINDRSSEPITIETINAGKTTVNGLPAFEYSYFLDNKREGISFSTFLIFVQKEEEIYRFMFEVHYNKPDNFDEIYKHVRDSIK
jgi:hypothetical protein